MLSTIGLAFSVVLRYRVYLQWMISRGSALKFDTLTSLGEFRWAVVEVIAALLSPYPLLDRLTYYEYSSEYKVDIKYSANDILMGFSFFRIYIFARVVLYMNKYMSPRAQRVCKMNGCEASSMFAIRSIIRE